MILVSSTQIWSLWDRLDGDWMADVGKYKLLWNATVLRFGRSMVYQNAPVPEEHNLC